MTENRLKTVQRKLAAEMRKEVNSLPSKGRKGTRLGLNKRQQKYTGKRLRNTVGKSVIFDRTFSKKGKTITNLRIRASGAKMPKGMQRIPRYMNQGQWRHPVFARKGMTGGTWHADRGGPQDAKWALQTFKPGWFDGTAAKFRPLVDKSVKEVLDEAQRIAGLR